jgi:hypothetical protein
LQEKAVLTITFLQILHQLTLKIICGIKHLRFVQGGLLTDPFLIGSSTARIARQEASKLKREKHSQSGQSITQTPSA